MYEGIFGFLLSFFLFFSQNFLYEIRKYIKYSSDIKYIIGLIFSLVFYMIISSVKNLFRVVTNRIYSPMTKTLSIYVLNPLYLIYYCFVRGDFKINQQLNPWYFSINVVLSLIISFFGCVFNEFIILLFCGLQLDTHNQISE